MSKNSEYLSMTKRSISWLFFIAFAIVVTYYFQGFSYKETFNSLPVSSAAKELPIYCVNTNKPQISITFDAAWGNEDTQKILNILKENNVKSTFFMTGGWVKQYPNDVKAIYEQGHDLGNHSANHKNMSSLSNEEICNELDPVTEDVKKLTSYQMNLFRPPYGDYDNHVIVKARECGYFSIQWSVDSLDWKNYGVDAIVNEVLNNKELKAGAIILMHNGAKYTAQALSKIIEGLKNKGYEIVPVSQLIYTDNYHINSEGKQIKNEQQTSTTKETVTMIN